MDDLLRNLFVNSALKVFFYSIINGSFVKAEFVFDVEDLGIAFFEIFQDLL